MKVTLELVERFHEKWNAVGNCWEWQAATMGRGYGMIKRPGERTQISAHRLSYMIHCGEIPDGMLVCHTCDNPKCVKPSHLFLGTAKDNLQDMAAKDRHLKGSRNAKAKLDEDKVRRIHQLHAEGISQGQLGRTFGVSQGIIWKIVHGKMWRHVYYELHGSEVANPAEHK